MRHDCLVFERQIRYNDTEPAGEPCSDSDSCKEADALKKRVRNLYIFFVFVLCMAACIACAACGKPYELIISDSGAKADDTSAAVREPVSAESRKDNSGTGTSSGNTADPDLKTSENGETAMPAVDENADQLSICVYVCGAVQNAGVYTLAPGSRVYEAIAAAGGLTEEAEPRALNQAQLLEDGQQITVYTREEIETVGSNSGSRTAGLPADGLSGEAAGGDGGAGSDSEAGAGLVNLNTAGREELMTLSGVGEARAAAIIAYREQNGGFTSPEEIMQIEGIGEKSYERLKDRITV